MAAAKSTFTLGNYIGMGANSAFGLSAATGFVLSIVQSEKDMCNMQSNINDTKSEIEQTKSNIDQLVSDQQDLQKNILDLMNQSVSAQQKYTQQIASLQNSAIAKRVIAVTLIFLFNLSILGSLVIKRLIAQQTRKL